MLGGGFLPPVIFEIQAKATEAIAEMRKVNGELDRMAVKGDLAAGSLGKLQKAGALAGRALIGLGAVAGVFAVSAIEQLDKVEKAQANLSTAIKNTGVNYNLAKPAIEEHAKAMANLGFTYDDTYSALAKMTAATGSPQIALDALSTAADIARFKTMSLSDAGTLLARSTTGQARGLRDLGIAMGITIPKGATLADILKAVHKRIGDAAVAFGKTLPGQLLKTKAEFQAIQISLGEKMLPKLLELTKWINEKGIPDFDKFTQFLGKNKTAIKDVALALGGIWATSKIIAGINGTIAVLKTLNLWYRAVTTSAWLAVDAETAAAVAGEGGIVGKTGGKFAGASKLILPAAIAGGVGDVMGQGAPIIGKKLGLTKSKTGKKVVRAGGTAAGAGAGALVGASLGTAAFPVIGSAVGAVLGTLIGGTMGFFGSDMGSGTKAGSNMVTGRPASASKNLPMLGGSSLKGNPYSRIPKVTKSTATKKPSIATQKRGQVTYVNNNINHPNANVVAHLVTKSIATGNTKGK